MIGFSRTKVLAAAAGLVLAAGVPALAQDYEYSPHQRYLDELNRPYEADGLDLGRDAPFLSTDDLAVRGLPRAPGGSFEIEGPPIGAILPVLPVERP